MPHIARPMEVHHHSEKIASGEFTINLNLALTIKLDDSGKVMGVSVAAGEDRVEEESENYYRRKEVILLPDIEPVDFDKEIINKFGEDF